MKNYYVSPFSMGISYAFINALCTLTGDCSLKTPQPASTNLLRRKLSEIASKYNINLTISSDAFSHEEINQVANHLIDNNIIIESDFLRTTEEFLTNNPDYARLPGQLAAMRKPLC